MKFSFYENCFDNEPRVVDVDDDEVIALIRSTTEFSCTPVDCVGKKCPNKNTEAFSPAAIEGTRHNSNVRSMSMLALEIDGLRREGALRVATSLVGLRHGVYSTHGHRGGDGKWSLRFLVWLSRPVRVTYRRVGRGSIPTAEDEWHRFYAAALRKLGIADLLDPLSDPSRLWFVPGHCSGVEPFSGYDDGATLDVDEVMALAARQNVAVPMPAPEVEPEPDDEQEFTDLDEIVEMLTTYRRSRAQRDTEEEREKGALIGRLLDGEPLAAPGGNAALTPEEPPADLPKGRGIAILRASGICVNYLPVGVPDEAYFEIFRRSIEAMRFGAPEGEREAMYEKLAESLNRNRARREAWDAEREADRAAMRALAERLAARSNGTKSNGANGVSVVEASETAAPPDDSWKGMLRRKGKGALVACGFNAYLILLYDPQLRGAARWNDVDKCLVTAGPLAGDGEVADVVAANYISAAYDVDIEPSSVYRQVLCVAYDNRFDPIKDYLRSIEWDGAQRIDSGRGWLVRYAGAVPDDENYVLDVGRKWLVQAVARALDPGCKADTVLIFEGDQGFRKSSLFEVLGSDWYCDAQLVLGDKDSKMLAGGQWIIELGEMASFKKSEQNAIKAFFSGRKDKFRVPYARSITSSLRRSVFVATTNHDGDDLTDFTGNRRYLPIKCDKKADLAAMIRDRDQIWAEAVHLYDRHVRECSDKLECGCWWFDAKDPRVVRRTDERVVQTPADEAVDAWWHAMAPEKRPKMVTTFEVAVASFECSKDRVNRGMTMDVGAALRKIGFKKGVTKVSGKSKRVFVPTEELLAAPQSEAGKLKDRRPGVSRPSPSPPN